MRVLPQDATRILKDSYILDFLDLPDRHSESDLQTGLLHNLLIPPNPAAGDLRINKGEHHSRQRLGVVDNGFVF